MEKTGCKIICGAPTTLALNGLTMMMMKGPNSVRRSDQMLQETSGRTSGNRISCNLIGPLHWFSVATERFVGLSPKVDQGLYSPKDWFSFVP